MVDRFFQSTIALSSATRWNSADKTAGLVLSNSDRTVTYPSGGNTIQAIRSIAAATSNQKVYIEHLVTAVTSAFFIGFATIGTALAYRFGAATPSTGFTFATPDSNFDCDDSADATQKPVLAGFTAGTRMCMAFDTALGKVWIRKDNGTWCPDFGGGDPAAGTGGVAIPFAGPYYAYVGMDANDGDVFTTAFASTDWVYATPSGFTQLSA